MDQDQGVRRLFLHEPGWQVALKADSHREFCHAVTPGEDHHHRLNLGEVFVFLGDEKLCLPCACRRNLFAVQPRLLRDPPRGLAVEVGDEPSAFELIP